MSTTITREDILARLQVMLHERFSLPLDRLGADARLRDLRVDSMHIVEMMLDLEDALRIKISSLSLPKDPTLGAVADAIAGAL